MTKRIVDLRSLARTHTEMCVRTLAQIAAHGKAPASARAFAATALLDRGWGKPAQIHAGDEDGGAINVIIRQMFETTQQSPLKLIEHEPDPDQLNLDLGQLDER